MNDNEHPYGLVECFSLWSEIYGLEFLLCSELFGVQSAAAATLPRNRARMGQKNINGMNEMAWYE